MSIVLEKNQQDEPVGGVPDLINNLASLGQSYGSESTDDQLLGVCTTVVPKAIVELMGHTLKEVCQQSGVSVTHSSLGTLLFGNVAGLQKAEALIKQFKTKLQQQSVNKSNGKTTDMSIGDDVQTNRSGEEVKNTELKEGALAMDNGKNNGFKITIKDSSRELPPKVEAPPTTKVVFNIISNQKSSVKLQDESIKSSLVQEHKAEVTQDFRKEAGDGEEKGGSKGEKNSDSDYNISDDEDPLLSSDNELQFIESPQDWSSDHKEGGQDCAVHYMCILCRNVYNTELELQDHECDDSDQDLKRTDEEVCHRKKKFVGHKCSVCPVTLPTSKLLAIHMEKLHSDEGQEEGQTKVTPGVKDHTPVDDHDYTTCSSLATEEVVRRGSTVQASQSKSFLDNSMVIKRLEIRKRVENMDGGKRTYLCEVCGKNLHSRSAIQRHRRMNMCDPNRKKQKPVISNTGSTFLCELCGKNLLSGSSLRRHMKRMNCTLYTDRLNSQSIERTSTSNTVIVDGVKRRSCELCHKVFMTRSGYNRHKKWKNCIPGHKVRPRSNPKANRDISNDFKMTSSNTVIVDGVKRRSCELCHKVFMSKSGYNKHKKWKNCVPGHTVQPRQKRKFKTEVNYEAWGFDNEDLEKAGKSFPSENKYIHQCNVCTYVSTYQGLAKHITRCHRKKNLTCTLCARQFTLNWELQRHMKYGHKIKDVNDQDSSQAKESHCDSTPENGLDSLLQEVSNHDNDDMQQEECTRLGAEQTDAEYTEAEELAECKGTRKKEKKIVYCKECTHRCTETGLRFHMLSHTSDYLLSCIICNKNLVDSKALQGHIGRHFDPNTKELILPKTQMKRSKLPRCVLVEGETYLCHECGSNFDNAHNLRIHQRQHEEERHANYLVVYKQEFVRKQCDCPEGMCQRQCSDQLLPVQVKKFGCPKPDCGVLMTRRTDVKRHVETIHYEGSPSACDQCDRKFKHFKNLEDHVRRCHRKVFRFYCHECGKGFYYNNRLRDHMEIHKDKPLRKNMGNCEVCGKLLSIKHLKKHMNKHTGVRPHKCDLCLKTFPFSAGLKRHMIHIHSTQKPHVCTHPGCHKAFKILSKLKYHMVLHTGDSKHKCERCDKVFTQRSTLKKHQQYHCDQTESTEVINMVPNAEPDNSQQMLNDVLVVASDFKVENPQIFMCSVCQATFVNFADIETHLLNHETGTMDIQFENT